MLGLCQNRGKQMLRDLSAPRAALFLAALAVVSALLSNFVSYVPHTNDFPKLDDVPLLPGLYFGVVIAIGVFLWKGKSAFELAVVIAAVVISWILAWRTAIAVSDFLGQFHTGDITAPDSRGFPFNLAISGIVAGLVGSLGTAIAISLVCPDFRDHADWLRTIALGTVTGALLHFVDRPWETVLPLLIVWQPVVAASVGYGLVIARKR